MFVATYRKRNWIAPGRSYPLRPSVASVGHGKEKMDQYPRSADRVREPEPSFHYIWTEDVAIVKEPLLEQR